MTPFLVRSKAAHWAAAKVTPLEGEIHLLLGENSTIPLKGIVLNGDHSVVAQLFPHLST